MSQMDSDQIINTQDIKQIIINDAKEKYQKMLMGQTKKVMPSKNVINNYGSYKENISNYAERIQNENNKFNTLLLRAKGNHDTSEKKLCENAYRKHILKKINIIEILRYLSVMIFFIIKAEIYAFSDPGLLVLLGCVFVLTILMIVIFHKLTTKYDIDTPGIITAHTLFFILFCVFCLFDLIFEFFASTKIIVIMGYIRYVIAFIPWRIYMLVSNKKRCLLKEQKTFINLTYIFIDVILVILLNFYGANIYYFIDILFGIGNGYFLNDIILSIICVLLMFSLIGILIKEIIKIKNNIVFFGKNVYKVNINDCTANYVTGKNNYEFIKINNREFKVK